MSGVLYTDNDPKCCAWLRELIAAGELPAGDVWCRDMRDIKPDEVVPFRQRHWCCGIGGWPLALQWAGWPDDEPVDTCSIPCQPWSMAGQRKGHNDDRHIWPAFYNLVRVLRPPHIFGEQVASAEVIGSATGRAKRDSGAPPVWFDGVCDDLESAHYAVGAAVIPACGVGAPHRRQRLFWVADLQRTGLEGHAGDGRDGYESRRHGAHAAGHAPARGGAGVLADAADANRRAGDGRAETGIGADGERGRGLGGGGDTCGLADAAGEQEHEEQPRSAAHERGRSADVSSGRGAFGGLGDTAGRGCGVGWDAPQQGSGGHVDRAGWARDAAGVLGDSDSTGRETFRPSTIRAGACRQTFLSGAWDHFDIIPCRDGKARRAESQPKPLAHGTAALLDALRDAGLSEDQIESAVSTFPLVSDGVGRMMLLKGYGNCICIPVAYEFIMAWREQKNLLTTCPPMRDNNGGASCA